LRNEWAKLIEEAVKKYKTTGTSDEAHCCTIGNIADILSERFGKHLVYGRMRYGMSQKAFNLYLKFLWRLGYIPMPPHCPIDGIVLRSAKLEGSWTKSDCPKEYINWIIALRAFAHPHPIGNWEYELWNQAPAR
jgi:hypothetical protein